MKSALFLSALACALVGRAEPAATFTKDAQPVHPGMVSYTVASDYQKGPNPLEVLLPEPLEPGRKYPVIYVLPVNVGTSGQWGSGIEELQKLNVANRYRAIVVAPAFDLDPWFGDTPKPTDGATPWIRQQGYVLDVVIPFIDREFPTRAERDGRFLLTFSKGGFGGFGLLLRNPNVFAKVAVYDCADPVPSEKIFQTWGMANVYGTITNFDQNFNIPRLLKTEEVVKALQDGPRRIVLMAGSLQYGGVETVHRALQDSKIPYTYIVLPGMGHSWKAGWLGLAVQALME